MFARSLTKVETIVRVSADICVLNLSVLAALFTRLVYLYVLESERSFEFLESFWNYSFEALINSILPISVIGFTVFSASGFYTHGRTYRGRYRVLVIFQAVSLVFLMMGMLATILPRTFSFPRRAILFAWIFALLLVGLLRIWSSFWRRAVEAEKAILGPAPHNKLAAVLVIGGAGYAGSVLVRKLLERGYYVKVLDIALYGEESVSNLLTNRNFQFVRGDFRNIDKVVKLMKNVDAVVHLGALVGDPSCTLDEDLTVETNPTRMLAEVAKGFAVQRFLFASSCSVYGASDFILNEKSDLNPVSLYARTKIDSERVLRDWNDSDFSPVILRFATLHGLSPRPRFDLVVNLLTARAVTCGKITIFGADQWRPFIHVSDAAEAIIRCMEAPLVSVKGQVFNVGIDDENYRISEIGKIVRRNLPETQVEVKNSGEERRNYRVSFEKIRRLVNFDPKKTVEDSVVEITNAIRSRLIEDWTDSKYSNIARLADEEYLMLVRGIHVASVRGQS